MPENLLESYLEKVENNCILEFKLIKVAIELAANIILS